MSHFRGKSFSFRRSTKILPVEFRVSSDHPLPTPFPFGKFIRSNPDEARRYQSSSTTSHELADLWPIDIGDNGAYRAQSGALYPE
jgi:hypothetical protein